MEGIKTVRNYCTKLASKGFEERSMTRQISAKSTCIKNTNVLFADQVFQRLSAILGFEWTKQFSTLSQIELVKDEWANAIDSFTFETISKAIDYIAKNRIYGILNLPKFVEICRDFEPKRNIKWSHEVIPMIENSSSEESKQRALVAKQEIRKLLGIKKSPNFK